MEGGGTQASNQAKFQPHLSGEALTLVDGGIKQQRRCFASPASLGCASTEKDSRPRLSRPRPGAGALVPGAACSSAAPFTSNFAFSSGFFPPAVTHGSLEVQRMRRRKSERKNCRALEDGSDDISDGPAVFLDSRCFFLRKFQVPAVFPSPCSQPVNAGPLPLPPSYSEPLIAWKWGWLTG